MNQKTFQSNNFGTHLQESEFLQDQLLYEVDP